MKMHHKKNFFYNLKGITGLFRYYRFIFQIHPSTLPITFLGLLRGIKIYQIWPYKLYFYRQWVRCPGCAIMETNDDFFVKWHDLARTKFRSFRFLADTDWGTGSFREVVPTRIYNNMVKWTIANQLNGHYKLWIHKSYAWSQIESWNNSNQKFQLVWSGNVLSKKIREVWNKI